MTIAVKRYYDGMNSNSPVLNGTAGSLISLLDAVLVNGFNSKTVTLSQTGGTATLSCSSHGFNVYDVISISGANESAWNDEFRVLTTTTNTLTFAIGSNTTSPATGTITAKIAPLGWTKPFSGTNKAAYLPKSIYSQCYLRVQDDSSTPISANGRWAKIRGYETMSDIDTGTGLFPTVAQLTNSLSLMKSNASDSTGRGWRIYGDGGIFYMFVFWLNSLIADCNIFGDINSIKAGDAYGCVITGTYQDTLPSGVGYSNNNGTIATNFIAQSGKYIARSYTQIGSSSGFCCIGDYILGGSNTLMGISGLTFPNGANGGLLYGTLALIENSSLRSKQLPGFYYPFHNNPVSDFSIIDSVADLPGRALISQSIASTGTGGMCFFDIIGPWR